MPMYIIELSKTMFQDKLNRVDMLHVYKLNYNYSRTSYLKAHTIQRTRRIISGWLSTEQTHGPTSAFPSKVEIWQDIRREELCQG